MAPVSGVVLDFDSAWFGLKIGRYDNSPAMAHDWAVEQSLDLVYCLLPIGQISQVREASMSGWKLVDVRVEFVHDLPRPWTPADQITHGGRARPAALGDVGWMQELARSAFTGTRFYNDRRLNRDRVDAMYANWVQESYGGFVVDEEGFVTVDDEGGIALIAVAPGARGRGVGSRLTRTVVAHAAYTGTPAVRVVTQGGNIAAQKTFQGCGFRSEQVGLWLHRWMR